MNMTKQDFEAVKRWMYRNARPLDIARWRLHFEGGDADSVIKALSAYQNEDGGFGHALEADSWNPESSPIQTWCATEIIHSAGVGSDHPVVKGVLGYLDSGRDFKNGKWTALVPSNNAHPHAPWWTYDEKNVGIWGYNPTAALAGYILKYAGRASSLFKKAERIAASAVRDYLANGPTDSMHELACFIRLAEYCEEAGKVYLFDLGELREKLKINVSLCLTRDTAEWDVSYVCKPSFFIRSPKSPFYKGNEGLTDYECGYIKKSRDPGGVWDINWKWAGYDAEFAVSRNWWKADLAIRNMIFLRALGHLEI